MKLLNDLFSTDYGLMSIIGIGFMLCMAAFFCAHVSGQDERAARTQPCGARRWRQRQHQGLAAIALKW